MRSNGKYKGRRLAILIGLTLAVIVIIFQFRRIGQDPTYHRFSDDLDIAGIPNFWNVISNIGFFIVGILGIIKVLRSSSPQQLKIIFFILFLGILLTGVGSAYYHLHPNNFRLIFDRIPMTVVFVSFLSAAIAHCINRTWGFVLLFPLLFIGIASVLWWYFSEIEGAGDLRFYALVQFLPILLVPTIFLLFRSPENRRIWPLFGWIIGWYILAKVLEHFDATIFQFIKIISGHSLKHFAATIATIYFITIFHVTAKSQQVR
jgi:hypothetical protein